MGRQLQAAALCSRSRCSLCLRPLGPHPPTHTHLLAPVIHHRLDCHASVAKVRVHDLRPEGCEYSSSIERVLIVWPQYILKSREWGQLEHASALSWYSVPGILSTQHCHAQSSEISCCQFCGPSRARRHGLSCPLLSPHSTTSQPLGRCPCPFHPLPAVPRSNLPKRSTLSPAHAPPARSRGRGAPPAHRQLPLLPPSQPRPSGPPSTPAHAPPVRRRGPGAPPAPPPQTPS